jgi:hypothetical protein
MSPEHPPDPPQGVTPSLIPLMGDQKKEYRHFYLTGHSAVSKASYGIDSFILPLDPILWLLTVSFRLLSVVKFAVTFFFWAESCFFLPILQTIRFT